MAGKDNVNHCKFLQYCKICEGYKAPRSHHCRKCDRCVMKMDHHCPWINTCVGHLNHGYFTYFLFWAVVGCLHAVSILCICLYRALNRSYYIFYHRGEPLVSLTLYGFMGSMFAAGLAIGVIIAVGILLFIQLKSVITNKTGIEQWITEKAQRFDSKEPEFIYPYDLGWRANISQVLGVLSSLCVKSGMPDSDGIWWPVRDSCTQFTLTIEQKAQKEEKRERSITYTIVEGYSGAFLPVSKGCRIVCSIPYTDEPRIPLKPGDEVSVTRWRRHWLYGEKRVRTDNSTLPPKGWFPRRCAVELTADDCDLSKLSKKYKKVN